MLLYGETDTSLTPKLIIDAQTGILDTISCVIGQHSNNIYFNNKNNTLVFNLTEYFKPEQISIFTMSGRKIATSPLPSWTNKNNYIIPLNTFWRLPAAGRYILQLKNAKEERRVPVVVD